jgi:hypothetical protein
MSLVSVDLDPPQAQRALVHRGLRGKEFDPSAGRGGQGERGTGCGSSHAARLKHCRSHAENTALANEHWTSRSKLRQIGTRLAFFCQEGVPAIRKAVRQAAQVMPVVTNRGTSTIKGQCLTFCTAAK